MSSWTLWLALASAGVQLDADVVLLAYVAGIVIASLPLLPGGIGAAEGGIPRGFSLSPALWGAPLGRPVFCGGFFFLPPGRLPDPRTHVAAAPRRAPAPDLRPAAVRLSELDQFLTTAVLDG